MEIPGLINTALLVALFWYQKNKNKVLSDRIAEQSTLLRETKDVIANQSEAIESQKKVVQSALEYANAFDLSKIEALIKKEADLEYQQVIKDKEEVINKHKEDIEKNKKAIMMVIEHMTSDYVSPLMKELMGLLLLKGTDEREKVLSNIPEGIANSMRDAFKEFDKNRPPGLLEMLSANKPINKDS